MNGSICAGAPRPDSALEGTIDSMLSRLFNLGGEFDRTASPAEQFFATIRRPLLVLFAGCFILFILFAERRPLWPEGEVNFATALQHSSSLHRVFLIPLDPVTPPLYGSISEFVALVRELFHGKMHAEPSAWSVRLPSVVSACLAVFAVYWLGLLTLSRRAAFLAAAITGLNLGFFRMGRWPSHEMLTVLSVTLAIGCWIHCHRTKRHADLFAQLFYVCAGFAALAGGAIGFLLPFLVALYSRISPPDRLVKDHMLGSGLFIFIVFGYALTMRIALSGTPAGNEMAGLFLWKSQLPSFTFGNIRQFLMTAILDYLPWSMLLPFALFHPLSTERAEIASQRLFRIWIQIGVFAAILTIGSTGDNLILAWPAAALLIGLKLDRLMAGHSFEDRTFLIGAWAAAISMISLGVLLLAPPNALLTLAWLANLEIHRYALDLMLFRMTATPLLAAGVLALIFCIRQHAAGLFWNLAFGMLLAAGLAALFVLPYEKVFR